MADLKSTDIPALYQRCIARDAGGNYSDIAARVYANLRAKEAK